MQRIICVLVVLATPLLLAAGNDDDVRKELKKGIKDGSSNTILVAGNAIYITQWDDGGDDVSGLWDESWARGGFGGSGRMGHYKADNTAAGQATYVLVPDQPPPPAGQPKTITGTFGGPFPGGVLAGFADGHVRNISWNVTSQVLCYLCVPNDGHVVSSEDF